MGKLLEGRIGREGGRGNFNQCTHISNTCVQKHMQCIITLACRHGREVCCVLSHLPIDTVVCVCKI